MKATLGLELFSDDQRQFWKLCEKSFDKNFGQGAGKAMMGGIPQQAWVAKIIAADSKYKFKRSFLRGKKDYSRANSKGSRGIYLWYVLENGHYYDVKEQLSWKTTNRYFCKVDDSTGNIIEVTEKEVEAWLKENSALMC